MKKISAKEAAALIKDGDSVMMGGFLGCGTAHKCVDALLEAGTKNLTMIGNDTAMADYSYGKLVVAGQLKKVIATHIGTNKETGRLMSEGQLEVDLVPQGTLAERIRAGGYGLGGVLVTTGLGTDVAKGKDIVKVDGKEFLLEKALRAKVALIYATKADKYGNLSYDGTTRNFNVVMAMAADIVIVEVEEFVDGALDPNQVIIPGVVVDYIVESKKEK
ncbi:branched-chain amino acid dehydrogenase [Campylobacter sp. MIT 12-8780]|uniref:CoA transferase subunit A n=1 Tax=unclassified Campylobacter TaxID=2593542 RepID=UPI0010F7ACB9|nr:MULTISPECIES: CoA transferase subunit A [unclassified Campylobacter]NDJ27870.1 CoA transferase subunit A [Campylobacter sp. MIT 19-121]TKX28971.1 branched-chain amino acid dehydrogenase [Campylobacter sp. MIT 12-5580]TQR40614.1 branched-chain amino acid dehydrogenase [Campylobacter sp. MIT 12-8780]